MTAHIDLALALLPIPEADPEPIRVSWMKAAWVRGRDVSAKWQPFWFTCRWMKHRAYEAANCLQYWSPNAVAPWDWPNPLPFRLAEFDRLLGVRK